MSQGSRHVWAQQLKELLEKTRLTEQIRTEYYAIWQRDRSRWDECRLALDMLALAEQIVDNMAAEGTHQDGT